MAFEKTNLEVYRYDPESGAAPHFDNFEVEFGQHTTVLDLLREIRSYQDGSLAFRMACRSAICGSCAMRVNGYAKLACQTRVADVVRGGNIILEPLGIYPAIRDLIVDLDPFWHQNDRVMPYLEPKGDVPEIPTGPADITRKDVEKMSRLADCILCACCTSSCNSHEVDPEFQGPQALAKSCRFALDPRDALGPQRGMRETSPRGAYWCCYCNFCSEVCPKDVRPAEAITVLKSQAFTIGIPNDAGARRSLTFYDTMRQTGRINEGILPVRAKRLGIVAYVPLALQMLPKGKLPTPLVRPIPRYWEVRKIYDNREAKGGLKQDIQIDGGADDRQGGPGK